MSRAASRRRVLAAAASRSSRAWREPPCWTGWTSATRWAERRMASSRAYAASRWPCSEASSSCSLRSRSGSLNDRLCVSGNWTVYAPAAPIEATNLRAALWEVRAPGPGAPGWSDLFRGGDRRLLEEQHPLAAAGLGSSAVEPEPPATEVRQEPAVVVAEMALEGTDDASMRNREDRLAGMRDRDVVDDRAHTQQQRVVVLEGRWPLMGCQRARPVALDLVAR